MAHRLFLLRFTPTSVGTTNFLSRLTVCSMISVFLAFSGFTASNLNAQTDSKIEDSKIEDSKIEDSKIEDSKIEDSKIEDSKISDSNQAEIEAILKEQTDAWNEGDLEKFMQTYWNSDKLTFCSRGKTTYGWQPTLDNYKKSYPTKEKMGRLHFDGLEVAMIESNSALVLGKWHLRMADESKLDGNFTLVVKKFDSTWKIIHDHSSTLEPREEKPDSD